MEQFFEHYKWWIIVGVTLWVLPWKGMALWKAAEMKNKIWFVVFLLINTLGILEIIFIFFISERLGGKKNEEEYSQSTKLSINC